ncbi:MAG: hypothetical protein WBE45_17180 [Terriglobales bacterium]|jgi:hypothetical protein
MVAGLQVLSAGQNPPAQNPPAQSPSTDDAGTRTAPAAALSGLAGIQGEGDAIDTSGDLPQIPALLGGTGISSAFASELERSNYLRGGLNVGAVYDSNALLSSPAESNTGVSIFPNIKLEQSMSRMRYTLGYAGGLTVNENLASQNQQAQNVNFDSLFRLSPHVNLRIAENFFYTTGFFDAGNGTEAVGGSGGPNASLITPLITQRSNVTTVETNYHFALNDLIGASGSFFDLHFGNLQSGSQPLTNTQTASGSVFWLHRIFRDDWGGITYHFDRITFDPGGGESQVHSFYAVNTLNLSNRFTLTGFIGPQYSDNQGLAPITGLLTQSTDWSVAGGVDGGWKNLRTSVSAGYSRTISDGGGVLGAVWVQNVHGNFRRELVPGWTAALTASYGTNQSITVPFASSANSVNLTSAGIALERNVRKSIGLRMGYTHDFQEQFGLSAPTLTQDASRNRFFVTLSYQWAKPLGM